MTSPSHTPAPWSVGSDADDQMVIIARIDQTMGCHYEGCLAYFDRADSSSAGNAAHAVKCVNAHDNLIRAIEGALDAFAWHEQAAAFQPSGSNGMTVVEELRAALAKVRS